MCSTNSTRPVSVKTARASQKTLNTVERLPKLVPMHAAAVHQRLRAVKINYEANRGRPV
jgi:hypothetical protein